MHSARLFGLLALLLTAALPAAARTVLGGDAVFYVDANLGSDYNECTAPGAGACKTWGRALHEIQTEYDFAGHSVSVQTACGTYPETVSLAGPWLGATVVHVFGVAATPTCVQQVIPGGASGWLARDGMAIDVNYIYFTSSGTNSNGLVAQQFGIVDFANVTFGALPGGGAHILCSQLGSINPLGPYTVTGGASSHVRASENCRVGFTGNTVTFSGSPIFNYYYEALSGAVVQAGVSYTGAASVTAIQWSVSSNAMLFLYGSTVPGNVAGGISSGGLVIH